MDSELSKCSLQAFFNCRVGTSRCCGIADQLERLAASWLQVLQVLLQCGEFTDSRCRKQDALIACRQQCKEGSSFPFFDCVSVCASRREGAVGTDPLSHMAFVRHPHMFSNDVM